MTRLLTIVAFALPVALPFVLGGRKQPDQPDEGNDEGEDDEGDGGDEGPIPEVDDMADKDAWGIAYAEVDDPLWPIAGDARSKPRTWARGRVTDDVGDGRPIRPTKKCPKPPCRHHVGEDLRAPPGTEVLAIAPGRVVYVDPTWYPTRAGVYTAMVLVEGERCVLAYGEVDPSALPAVGVELGRGDVVGIVGATRMLHLEAYVLGTRRTYQWAWGAAPPPRMLDPVRLLQRAARGVPA